MASAPTRSIGRVIRVRQAGDVDPAVGHRELVAGALLQLLADGCRDGRLGEAETPVSPAVSSGVGGPDQHGMAGAEQDGAVLAGDVGVGCDDQLGGQVELGGHRFGGSMTRVPSPVGSASPPLSST